MVDGRKWSVFNMYMQIQNTNYYIINILLMRLIGFAAWLLMKICILLIYNNIIIYYYNILLYINKIISIKSARVYNTY